MRLSNGTAVRPPSPKPTVAALCAIGAAAWCIFSIDTCLAVNSSIRSNSLSIIKEVLVRGVVGRPAALVQISGGGFAMVGAGATAWAAETDGGGVLLWKYVLPPDPTVHMSGQSAYRGVVALANGGILACGELWTKKQQTAIVTILDSRGVLVQQRTLFPKDDTGIRTSSFQSCFPWGDGFALTGRWYDGQQAYYWLLKLDRNGIREWEKLGDELPGLNGVVNEDQSLTLVGIPVHGTAVKIARFNPKGELIATRKTAFSEARAVRSVTPTSVIRVIGVDSDNRNVLLSLAGDLHDTSAPKQIAWLNIREGCAYNIADGSVVLFGNKFIDGAIYRSSIGWLDRHDAADDEHIMAVPDKRDTSYTVSDAAPISSRRFVTVRDLERSVDPENNGVVLSWVTF